MTDNVIWAVLSSKNKTVAQYPGFNTYNRHSSLCEGEIGDILSFGFSYVEHEDHFLEYIVANPTIIRRLIKEVNDFTFSIDKPYIGELWTAKVYITDRLKNTSIFFSNHDFSVVLNLNLNNIKIGVEDAPL
jgi:hypothetical protein